MSLQEREQQTVTKTKKIISDSKSVCNSDKTRSVRGHCRYERLAGFKKCRAETVRTTDQLEIMQKWNCEFKKCEERADSKCWIFLIFSLGN